ncbi:MAG: hypothetical protein VB875_10085, partial [Pirellulales bacterium]
MKKAFAIVGLVVVGWIGITNRLPAENWPIWRGPRGDGTSSEKSIPRQWDATSGDGVVWKVAIAGEGHASPIVWDEHIFLVSCLKETKRRVLSCLDRGSGSELWRRTVM